MLSVLVLACCSQATSATTLIKLVPGQSKDDTRHIYPHKILRLALDATVQSHGPYEIVYGNTHFTRNRTLIELQTGQYVNVHEAPTREEWEKQAIPIYIPVRKGLLGYRLLLIDKKSRSTFENMRAAGDLKELYAGLGEQWSTTKAMDALGFNIVTGNNYEGLFSMLMAGRFDYFPRGVNELFEEYETRKSKYPNMVIEPSKALYIPSPTFFFVSPAFPELADRIEEGMREIINDGTFDLEFSLKFGNYLKLADLGNRQVFKMDNPLLSEQAAKSNEQFRFRH